MKHYIFDLDDTLILHKNNINYDMIYEDIELKYYLNKCKGPCYIYTNGTGNHALTILNKMNIKSIFDKIYSRDTIPFMKPYYKSYNDIQNDIFDRYPEYKTVYFFDDRLENLKTAHEIGWKTFWIHSNYLTSKKYNFINMSFPNIKDCLKYLETKI